MLEPIGDLGARAYLASPICFTEGKEKADIPACAEESIIQWPEPEQLLPNNPK